MAPSQEPLAKHLQDFSHGSQAGSTRQSTFNIALMAPSQEPTAKHLQERAAGRGEVSEASLRQGLAASQEKGLQGARILANGLESAVSRVLVRPAQIYKMQLMTAPQCGIPQLPLCISASTRMHTTVSQH